MSTENEPPVAAAAPALPVAAEPATPSPAPAPAVAEAEAEAAATAAPDAAPDAAAEVAAAAEQPAALEKKASLEKKVSFQKTTEEIKTGTPLSKLFEELPAIVKDAEYEEMWGVELKDDSHVPTTIVLEKFLRANGKDVSKAKSQLTEALKWRKLVQPTKLLEETEFDSAKYGNLGYVTAYQLGEKKEIITWNVYGAVKDNKATFGDVQEFIKWRSALMELSVKELDLASATIPIPEDGVDVYKMVQVHDYLNVSFLRMDPATKAASKETIQVFSMAYPELLKEKFFVNVPLLMGWVFTAMKVFLAPETVKKFHPLAYGKSLAGELKELGPQLPEEYGGSGTSIKQGLTVKYAAAAVAPAVAEEQPAP